MGGITKQKYKKGKKEYVKYVTVLPKDQMDMRGVRSGDELQFVGEMSGILQFKLIRKEEKNK